MPTHNGLLPSAPSMALVGYAIIGAASQLAAQTDLPPARPLEPISAIAKMLESHRVVAIGNVEFRGDEQCQAFLRSLVRDARFPTAGTDIVVEFGNARYQLVMDRFINGAHGAKEVFVDRQVPFPLDLCGVLPHLTKLAVRHVLTANKSVHDRLIARISKFDDDVGSRGWKAGVSYQRT